MRVLVTGGAGFIGSHVCEALVDRGDQVICVDFFDPHYSVRAKLSNLSRVDGNPQFGFLEGDLREPARLAGWLQGEHFDAIAHLAGRDSDRESLVDPQPFFNQNIDGTLGALEVARRLRISRFVMTSSASVYGVSRDLPFREDTPTNAIISPNGVSKLAAEALCHTYAYTFGVRAAILRLFTIYGPRQRPDMAIRRFADALLRGDPIPVYGDGKAGRDFTYVSDAVESILLALDKDLECEIINVATGQLTPVLDVVRILGEALRVEPDISFRPPHPGDLPDSVADITKARELLGYQPKVTLEEGIARFVEWFRAKQQDSGREG